MWGQATKAARLEIFRNNNQGGIPDKDSSSLDSSCDGEYKSIIDEATENYGDDKQWPKEAYHIVGVTYSCPIKGSTSRAHMTSSSVPMTMYMTSEWILHSNNPEEICRKLETSKIYTKRQKYKTNKLSAPGFPDSNFLSMPQLKAKKMTRAKKWARLESVRWNWALYQNLCTSVENMLSETLWLLHVLWN